MNPRMLPGMGDYARSPVTSTSDPRHVSPPPSLADIDDRVHELQRERLWSESCRWFEEIFDLPWARLTVIAPLKVALRALHAGDTDSALRSMREAQEAVEVLCEGCDEQELRRQANKELTP